MATTNKWTVQQWICNLNSRVTKLENGGGPPSSANVFFGDGPPASSLGKNGDFYARFDGSILYEKIDLVWVPRGEFENDVIDGGTI